MAFGRKRGGVRRGPLPERKRRPPQQQPPSDGGVTTSYPDQPDPYGDVGTDYYGEGTPNPHIPGSTPEDPYGTGGATAPAPTDPGPVDSLVPPQPKPPTDAQPAPSRQPLPSTTTNPLVEEGVQVSDPTGVSTFARPGARSFQPFQGRVLAQRLRDPRQQFGLQAHDLNAASRRGDIGRTTALGQGGSLGSVLGSAGGRNRLEDEVLRQFGLA